MAENYPWSFALGLFVALGFASKLAMAQTQSDLLFEDIRDHTDRIVIPGLSFLIPEGGNEVPPPIPIPSRTVDFFEPITSTISDRFRLNAYQVLVQSDDEIGLPRRPNAILIPASALESFTPLFIAAGSDGDTGTGESDRLTIAAGVYPGFGGTVLFDQIIPENPNGEFVPFGPFVLQFDVEEVGQPGVISDYVDLINIQGFFLSSDNPNDEHYQGPFDGFIIEKNGPEFGKLNYMLNFESDVPEPTAAFLLGIGVLSVGRTRRR
jgi:hypothetical protein